MTSLWLICLCAFLLIHSSWGWSPGPFFGARKVNHSNVDMHASRTQQAEKDACESRRRFLSAAAMQIILLGAAASPADAAETTTYKSGKAPIVPGQKPKDKSDVKGTRKDPDFLRSISDCKNQCQSSNGADGYARSKEDCLSECQDVCCTTYEQW